ncbi:MAG: radical SAM family heme chaperone HemW [Cytophagales bacterium]|nr:radical SAM family heme chaperone HemW [Cytophagales bacterium]
MSGIYLHIPYCSRACSYCDFHFSTSLNTLPRMMDIMREELFLRRNYLDNSPVKSIYIGGGTPSLLSLGQIEVLLKDIETHYGIRDVQEITMEVNPENLRLNYLRELRNLGINRLSIGIQSFQEDHLRRLRRTHNVRQAHQAIDYARHSGFDSFSIDLIYGIPAPSHKHWQKDLEQVLDYHPPHISAYALSLEPHTLLYHQAQKKIFIPASEEFVEEQFHQLHNTLSQDGYEHYEVSNFALNMQYAQHNTLYWQNKKYLGIGPSASSYDLKTRQSNIKSNAGYLKCMREKKNPWIREKLSPEQKYQEYLLTHLRTKWGVKRSELNLLFPSPNHQRIWEKEVFHLTKHGYLVEDKGSIRVLPQKWIVLDSLVERLAM